MNRSRICSPSSYGCAWRMPSALLVSVAQEKQLSQVYRSFGEVELPSIHTFEVACFSQLPEACSPLSCHQHIFTVGIGRIRGRGLRDEALTRDEAAAVSSASVCSMVNGSEEAASFASAFAIASSSTSSMARTPRSMASAWPRERASGCCMALMRGMATDYPEASKWPPLGLELRDPKATIMTGVFSWLFLKVEVDCDDHEP